MFDKLHKFIFGGKIKVGVHTPYGLPAEVYLT
jgi:hypothetical protein